jgi:hypothetical protein
MGENFTALDVAGRSLRAIGDQRFSIGNVGAGDAAQVERLFERVFGAPTGPGWYEWKYGALGGSAVGLWGESGELLAHYAGFPRQLRWYGKALPAIQIGDVMVAPEVRGLFTRRGPFYQVCSSFFSAHVGVGNECALAFGFPNERAIRLGVKLGLYHDAGVIHQLAWPARVCSMPFAWAWRPLQSGRELSVAVERGWLAMSRDFSDLVLGVRDATFVANRFVRRPGDVYRFFGLYHRLTRRVVAVAVMRLASGQAELVDLIGGRSTLPLLIRGATSEAARVGAETLSAWAGCATAAILQETGANNQGTVAHLAIAKASMVGSEDLLTTPWWWMGGDTDFL